MYSVPVIAANVSLWCAGLNSYEGLALTLSQTAIVETGTLTSSAATVSGLMNATTQL